MFAVAVIEIRTVIMIIAAIIVAIRRDMRK